MCSLGEKGAVLLQGGRLQKSMSSRNFERQFLQTLFHKIVSKKVVLVIGMRWVGKLQSVSLRRNSFLQLGIRGHAANRWLKLSLYVLPQSTHTSSQEQGWRRALITLFLPPGVSKQSGWRNNSGSSQRLRGLVGSLRNIGT